MDIDLSRARETPYAHQIVGIRKLVEEPVVGLFDEMGAGKTKQVIDAAQVLFTRGVINRVLIIAPASVRFVWFDQELGELSKHLWNSLPARVTLFHGKTREWKTSDEPTNFLHFLITNYEFIRARQRLYQMIHFAGQKTMLVLDESSAVKSYGAEQTKACAELRKLCHRVVLLNGTPIANSPKDMFSQGQLLSKKILECKTYYNFRARYGIMGGWQGRQVIQWQNLDDLQRRFAPYVLRRLKEDCLDLPKKLPSVMLTAALTEKTWKVYKEMREEMIVWLTNTVISTASQAAVKGMRLAQVTSGFLGGVHDSGLEPDLLSAETEPRPDFIPATVDRLDEQQYAFHAEGPGGPLEPIQSLSTEKLDVVVEWLENQLEADENLKLLIWCRFRPELDRMYAVLMDNARLQLGRIWGGQKKDEREQALRLLDPRTMPKGPVVVLGTPSSGSMGLNLTGAHTVVYMSNDYSLKTRLQSEDRVHRPGQVHPVSYFDVVATGPTGQKTIDHAIIKALRNKNDLATWTTSAWLDILREEKKHGTD
jgi:SNF2 family DNA or RNA helicase